MSVPPATRPDAEEPRSRLGALAAGPHVRQATAEITARLCEMLPLAAVATAASGLAAAAIIVARRNASAVRLGARRASAITLRPRRR